MRTLILTLVAWAWAGGVGAAPPPPPIRGNPYTTNIQGQTVLTRSPLVQSNASVTVYSDDPAVTNDFANLYIQGGKLSVDRMWISLIDTGGDPTAMADSRNALQKALNAARVSGAGVFVPAGDFRICYGMFIYVGNVPIYGPGKLWASLPDGYTNPNVYGVSETYVATGMVDQNGNVVSHTNSFAFPGPWNGKGNLFLHPHDVTISVNLDGGWGTTNAPGNVRPITGVKTDGDEFTYYNLWNSSQNVRFDNCRFSNAPGDYISVGYNVYVTGCSFTEYGDHIFYFGQSGDSQQNYQFIGNRILTGRAQVGVLGELGYVGVSSRDMVKFRGNRNIIVADNIATNTAGNLTRFADLETWSQQPGHCANVTISGNTFTGERFLSLTSTRDATPVSAGFGGWMVKDVMVQGNVINASEYAFLMNDASVENVTIANNLVNSSSGLIAQIHGNMFTTNGVNGLRFLQNKCRQGGGADSGDFALGED